MPRKSDNFVKNTRAKARRRMKQYEEGIKTGKFRGQMQQEAQKRIADYKTLIQQTMMKDETGRKIAGRTPQFVRERAERLERMNTNNSFVMRNTAQARANKMAQNELNLASSKDALSNAFEKVGKYSYVDKGVFYQATSRLFNAKDGNVNQQIMEKLGINDLGGLVDAIIEHFDERVQKFKQGGMTDAEMNEQEKNLRSGDTSQDQKYAKHPDAGVTRYIPTLTVEEIQNLYAEYITRSNE